MGSSSVTAAPLPETVVPLQHIFHALRKRWWLPIAAGLTAAALAFLVAKLTEGHAPSYNALVVVTVTEDPLIFHTAAHLVHSYEPAWPAEQIALFEGARARAIAAGKAGVPTGQLQNALSVSSIGGGQFAISLSDLSESAAQRAATGVLAAFRQLRRELVRRAAATDSKRVTAMLAQLQSELNRLQKPALNSLATKRLTGRISTLRGELAADRTLLSVLPSGLTVDSTSFSPRRKIVRPVPAALAALAVGLALGCCAALIAVWLESSALPRQTT